MPRHFAARFFEDQRRRARVPGLQARFPESVHATGSDPADIDRGRTEAPDGARLLQDLPEDLEELVGLLVNVVRKARHEHRLEHRRVCRRLQPLPVHPRSDACFRREELLAIRIVDGGDDGLPIDLEGERGAEDRHSVGEVGGAVERIEHPAMARPAHASAELFRQHVMIREALRDHRAKHPLDFEIDLGDQIDGALFFDTHAGVELGDLEIAGAHDRFDRGREEQWIGFTRRSHGGLTRPLFGVS